MCVRTRVGQLYIDGINKWWINNNRLDGELWSWDFPKKFIIRKLLDSIGGR